GNINWDVPFPRALELAERTRAQVLAGLPLEPVVLAEIARTRGIDPAELPVDTLFLGGAAVPPALQRRLARVWGARVIELYGSTETMLLGTSCPAGTLHPETGLAYCEVLPDGRVEIERLERGMLLDVELLSRSPHVYKPVVLSDWRRPGRRILTVGEGMIEWPRPTWAEGRRWLARTIRTAARRRRLARDLA